MFIFERCVCCTYTMSCLSLNQPNLENCFKMSYVLQCAFESNRVLQFSENCWSNIVLGALCWTLNLMIRFQIVSCRISPLIFRVFLIDTVPRLQILPTSLEPSIYHDFFLMVPFLNNIIWYHIPCKCNTGDRSAKNRRNFPIHKHKCHTVRTVLWLGKTSEFKLWHSVYHVAHLTCISLRLADSCILVWVTGSCYILMLYVLLISHYIYYTIKIDWHGFKKKRKGTI